MCSPILLIALWGCTSQKLSQSVLLRNGMSKNEVSSIMGDPIRTEFSEDLSAWHWCRTGISDKFVAAIFKGDQLLEVKQYTVTAGEANGYGDCSAFVRRVDWSSYQNRSVASPPKGEAVEPRTLSGTGWLLDSGYVVTNQHVVNGASKVVLLRRNGDEVRLQLIAEDKANDIALLRADEMKNGPGLQLVEEESGLGATVFTIGFPHTDLLGSSPKLSTGIVSSQTGFQDDPRTYQISVPLQSGNSGGPLVNEHGMVVGIVTAKLDAIQVFMWTGDLPENVNYAVKTAYLEILLKRYTRLRIASIPARERKTVEVLAGEVEPKVFQIVATRVP